MSTFFCTYSVDVWFGLPLCSRGAVDCTTKRLSNPTFCSQDSIRHCKAKKGNLFWEKFNNSRHARATTHCHVLASSSRPPNGKFLTSRIRFFFHFKICNYVNQTTQIIVYLEPSCCKKGPKKSQPRNWFEE